MKLAKNVQKCEHQIFFVTIMYYRMYQTYKQYVVVQNLT